MICTHAFRFHTSASRILSIISTRYPEHSPEYLESLHLCGNNWFTLRNTATGTLAFIHTAGLSVHVGSAHVPYLNGAVGVTGGLALGALRQMFVEHVCGTLGELHLAQQRVLHHSLDVRGHGYMQGLQGLPGPIGSGAHKAVDVDDAGEDVGPLHACQLRGSHVQDWPERRQPGSLERDR